MPKKSKVSAPEDEWFNSFKKAVESTRGSLPELSKKLQKLSQQVATEFNMTSFEEIRKACAHGENFAVNPKLCALETQVHDALLAGCKDFRAVSMWIHMNIPDIQDGNNYGVGIQVEIVKNLVVMKKELGKMLEELPEWHSKRAGAVEKLRKNFTKKTNKIITKSNKSEQSKKSTTKEVKSGESGDTQSDTSSKESQTHNLDETFKEYFEEEYTNPDYENYLTSMDVMRYGYLSNVMQDLLLSYSLVYNQISKNMKKLVKPRGESSLSRGGYSSMY